MKILNIPVNRFRILFILGLMSASAVGLFILKTVLTHNFALWGINWNLFLAWIPIFIVLWLEKKVKINALQRWEVLIVSLLWLLFFPNAPYIITDLVHLQSLSGNTYWHYQIMIFTYAFVSLACGLQCSSSRRWASTSSVCTCSTTTKTTRWGSTAKK